MDGGTMDSKSLGQSLQELGKIFFAKEQISELEQDVRQAKENLTAVDKNIGSINHRILGIPSFTEFKEALQNCLDNAESLGAQIATIGKEHEAIENCLMGTFKHGTLDGKQVSSMAVSLQSFIVRYEEYGKNLLSFVRYTKELETVAQKVREEALSEEQGNNASMREAKSIKLSAQLKSVRQWVCRICTFGLITLSSSFQDSVRSNNETYQRVDLLFEKYKKARELFDIAFKTIEDIAGKMDGRPVRLTEELLQIVRSVLQRYETVAEAQKLAAEEQKKTAEAQKLATEEQKKTAEAQKLAAEMENTIHEQEEEIRRKNEALAEEIEARKKLEQEKEEMAKEKAKLEEKLRKIELALEQTSPKQ